MLQMFLDRINKINRIKKGVTMITCMVQRTTSFPTTRVMKRLLVTSITMASIMAQAAINSPRSGEIFQTTREGPGLYAPVYVLYGLFTPVVGWVTLLPAGIAIGVVDELVVSPAIDLVCLPYDLMQPHHGFTIRVRDAEGEPVKGAKFSAEMETAATWIQGSVCEVTDARGEIYVSKLNRVVLKQITIEKDGYYSYGDWNGRKIDNIKPDAEGRLVLDFVMKRKVRSVEKVKSSFDIPESLRWQSVELLFDCEAGDWLPPYGKGKTADLQVKQTFECKDAANPRWQNQTTIAISAVGHGNGFVEDGCNWHDGMPGAYEVPSDAEFAAKPVVAVYLRGCGSGTKDFDPSKYMIMRLRTRFSEDGKVVGAHYGKMLFQNVSGCIVNIQFVRDENETWIE